MKKICLALILLLSLSNNIYSYHLKKMNIDDARTFNYLNNDLIFIGKVVKIHDHIFTFKSIEVFKGNFDSIYQVQINFDYKIGEKYLIYAQYQNDRKSLKVDECSISRSFSDPIVFNLYDLPSPPLNNQEAKEKFNNALNILQLQAKIDLVEEVDWLRGKKIMELFQKNERTLNQLTNYFIYVSLFLFILVIFLFFKRFKKAPSSIN